MLRDNRVLFKRQGTIKDLSPLLSNIHGDSIPFDYSVNDFLYIASYLPFNHRHISVESPNSTTASLSVDIWNGETWVPALDIVDETAVNGAALGTDGKISFVPDPDRAGWCQDDTKDMIGSGIEAGPKIFGLYWARLSWSATLELTTALSYVGHKFSEDSALEAEYPDLARASLKDGWKTGKIDWEEQTLLAAEYIVQHLKGPKYSIVSPDQIMEPDVFEKASVHRTAMIIFKGLGQDYESQLAEASKAYNSAIDVRQFEIDLNRNGSKEPAEKEIKGTRLYR